MITANTILSTVGEVIRTRDEKKICATIYRPVKEGDKLVIIGSSAFETQDCYEPLARYLAEQGIVTITFDYRGMGQSTFDNAAGAYLHHWGNFDLDAVLRYAKNNFQGKEIIFLAHGVSGELVGLAAASQYINRMVLINSVLSCNRLWPFHHRIKLFLLKRLRPIFGRLFRFINPGYFVSPHLPSGVCREWVSWRRSTNGLFDAFPDNNYRRLQVPLLAFSFSDDWHSPIKAVSALLQHFESAAITWFHAKPQKYDIRQAGHSGFFRPSFKILFWQPLLHWFDDQQVTGYKQGTLKMVPGLPID